MDLKEFVSQTLLQIIEGVHECQEQAKAFGAEVNPHLNSTHTEMGKQNILWAGGRPAQIVQFDVALTVIEGTGTKGGIGIFAGAINLGSSGQSQSESSIVSRIKFGVPMVLPK
ncbi:MAG: hypothetical protein KA361_00855 [Chromatiaceae bacterium]|nr:hypothetical protein [Chromatiaceae bacterium]MBP9603003.1 hypothetical protein [Chromatiaceae bacterium]